MIKRENTILLVLLVLLSFIPLIGLFQPGFPVTHDGQDHIARIANFYQNLHEGTLIPRWAGNLNWGYGHPILMYLYPLPSYLASLFHLFGFSFVVSTKLVFGVTYILSGLTMFLWLRSLFSGKAAMVGSLLYIFAPYRFVDLYVRGAIGEHVAFVFPPLVCYFLFQLSKKWSYWYLLGGSLSLAGLILAHNAISIMFLPLLIFYAAYLLWNSKHRKSLLLSFGLILAFGFSLSSFFWLPAFMEGKYTLRDIVTENIFSSRFVSMQQLLYGVWNYGQSGQFSVQVGLLQWIFVLASVPLLLRLKKHHDRSWVLILGILIFFFFTLWLMLPYSQIIWEKVKLLQKFQFPWRFLSVSVFLTAILGAMVFSSLPKKFQGPLLITFILLLLFVNQNYWHARAFLQRPESFYTGIYHGTTDTGESSPIWSIRFMEKTPKAHLEAMQGKAVIQEVQRQSTIHQYKVTVDRTTRMRENTLYFPGWQIMVDNKRIPVEFQDAKNRGIMTFPLEKGQHDIVVRFTDTKLRLLANMVSLISIVGIGCLAFIRRSKIWQS